MTTRRPRNTDPRNFQSVIRHEDQATPCRQSVASPDTAIGIARSGFEHGACVAQVIRKTDNVVIWDGPAGISLDYQQWYA